MAAVNYQVMSTVPIDFHPHHSVHSRSNSVSSSSTHSSLSRPHSAHGPTSHFQDPSLGASVHDDIYRASYQLGHLQQGDHSPPNQFKAPSRPSHIRASRVSASPYPRDTDSVHSSSSETEEMAMYLSHPAADYNAIYAQQPPQPPPQTMAPSQEAMHAASAFGRMALSPDHALEKLAANVRAATTTSASDRAKQIFVQAWLTANYAPYPDGNVPRQGLYFSYRRVCDQYGIPHINTATLGKAIRLCFPTIKTRRLGVRGNSKYHYCGIRPATSAEAEFLQEYITKSNNNAGQSSINAARQATSGDSGLGKSDDRSDEDEDDDSEGFNSSSAAPSKRNSLTLAPGDVKARLFAGEDLSDKTPTAASLLARAQGERPSSSSFAPASIRRSLQPSEPALSLPSGASSSSSNVGFMPGQPTSSVRQLPHFPSIEEAGANSASPHGVAAREVWGWFQDHLDSLLESVRCFRFDQFEIHVRTFWGNLGGGHREVVHAPAIAGLMAKADAIVYDEILEILRSQMLSPITANALAALRQLAKKMENILVVALEGYGKTFLEPKVELGARFGHLVLRFLDIYQVTQALNTVLTNQKQLAEMRRSWQKIDFESVRNQSALVCNCRHEDLLQLLEVEFLSVLDSLSKSPEPVRDVMTWADKCCERLMGDKSHHSVDDRSTMSSRSVLIRWGYVTSQVMRDLTIRSDPAFGAFQILKLFLDDWIGVNVLRAVALSTNSVAASVEPAMQQQFFSLSPMAGQESFNTTHQSSQAHPSQTQHGALLAHTPTTSSMLAALQQDPFPSFNAEGPYSSMPYMDTTTPQEELPPQFHVGDYGASAGGFDVPSFVGHELGMPTQSGTPGSEHSEHGSAVGEGEGVKSEAPSA